MSRRRSRLRALGTTAAFITALTPMGALGADTAPIKSASELDYPPFSVVQSDGSAGGFSVELMRAALNAMGRDVHFDVGLWPEIKARLAEGRLDALPLVGRTPEREALFDFSVPYISLYGAVLVRNDNHSIQSLADLDGKTVGVMRDDMGAEFVQRQALSDRIETTDTLEDALRALSAGEIDAVVAQWLVTKSLIEELGITNLRPAIYPVRAFQQGYCFAVREGDKELLATLNEGLSIIVANGEMDRLEQKWIGNLLHPDQERLELLERLLWALGAIFILVVTLAIVHHIRSHRALAEREADFRMLFENMPQGAVYQRPDGTLADCNPAALKLFGIDRERFLAHDPADAAWRVIREDGSEMTPEDFPGSIALATDRPVRNVVAGIPNRQKTEHVWISISAIPVSRGKNDRRRRALVTFHDISDRMRIEADLKHQAVHDLLTGLYNRTGLQQRVDKEMRQSARYGHPLSVFMVDADHFKRLNDRYGHSTGDQALRALAKTLQASVRDVDIVARYGGEEFLIALPETSLERARRLAERLRGTVEELRIPAEGGTEVAMTISIGVATYPDHADSFAGLVARADEALYAAKQAGRNRVEAAALPALVRIAR